MKELELNDGSIVKLDTRLNLKKLIAIDKDFDTSEFATIRFKRQSTEMNLIAAGNAVYIAYRQANMHDYLTYEKFLDLWDFDATFAFEVYAEMLQGNLKKKTTPIPLKK